MKQVVDRTSLVLGNVGDLVTGTPQPLRLLCATDLSRRLDPAVRRAVRLSRQLGAELLLFHSIAAASTERETRRKRVHAHMLLHTRARKWMRRGFISQVAVSIGPYRETIATMAREWKADLIILGSYRKRFGDSLVGTTAERVSRTARRPVLVVNRNVGGPYAHVLLTSDLSAASVGAARVTHDLGLLEGSSVSVVHAITSESHAMLRLSGVGEADVAKYVRQTEAWASREITRQLATAGLPERRFSIMAPQASPLGAIERALRLTRADLVIVGASRFPTIKRVFLGSVSNEVLRRLECDVLLVSPSAAEQARQAA